MQFPNDLGKVSVQILKNLKQVFVEDIDEFINTWCTKKKEYPKYLDWSGGLLIKQIDHKIIEIKKRSA